MSGFRFLSGATRPVLLRRGRLRGGVGANIVRVRVQGGYQPDVIHARTGAPLVIVFRRDETAACSDSVVFPTLGKNTMLPPFKDVAVHVVPPAAGEYEFTCGMGMLHGRLVVSDRETR